MGRKQRRKKTSLPSMAHNISLDTRPWLEADTERPLHWPGHRLSFPDDVEKKKRIGLVPKRKKKKKRKMEWMADSMIWWPFPPECIPWLVTVRPISRYMAYLNYRKAYLKIYGLSQDVWPILITVRPISRYMAYLNNYRWEEWYLRVPIPWTILTQHPSQLLTGGSGIDQLKGSPQDGSVWLLHSKQRTLPPAENKA